MLSKIPFKSSANPIRISLPSSSRPHPSRQVGTPSLLLLCSEYTCSPNGEESKEEKFLGVGEKKIFLRIKSAMAEGAFFRIIITMEAFQILSAKNIFLKKLVQPIYCTYICNRIVA